MRCFGGILLSFLCKNTIFRRFNPRHRICMTIGKGVKPIILGSLMPQISIITPAFNAAATIAAAIQSVQAQSFDDWEMIVVDDGSSDGTGAIVERFSAEDPRVRLIRRPENQGAAAARNHAIKIANGRYLAFLDAHNIWAADKLEQQLAFMQELSCGISYHAYRRTHVHGGNGRLLKGPARMTFETLLRKNCVLLSTVIIDRERVGAVTFPEYLPRYEAFALWLQLTRAGHDIVFLNQDLARHCLWARQPKNMFRHVVSLWRVYRKVANMPRGRTLRLIASQSFYSLWKRLF